MVMSSEVPTMMAAPDGAGDGREVNATVLLPVWEEAITRSSSHLCVLSSCPVHTPLLDVCLGFSLYRFCDGPDVLKIYMCKIQKAGK